MPLSLSTLLASLPQPPVADSASAVSGAPPALDPPITLVTADSRQAAPGALFVAVRGETTDGHAFIADAVRRGASAVVGQQPPPPLPVPYVQVPDSRAALAWLAAAWHGFPARRLVMIGVTGTDGKTTTANLLHSILAQAGLRAGLISTVNALIGGETLDTGLHTTTPDALQVQSLLARMAAAGLTHCILEATSHGLAQERVTACEFDVAVVTNITHEHLDYHGTPEAYRAAKARLFAGLGAAAQKPGQEKVAVLNRDDSAYDYLMARATGRPVSYSQATTGPAGGQADFRARDVSVSAAGARFEILGAGLTLPVETRLPGRFNVSNCLAAAAAALAGLDVPPQAVRAGLQAAPEVPGRLERVDLGQPFAALVDFAHTPNALQRALEAARDMTVGRVIVVFGSAGLRDRRKRRLMPAISARLADVTVLTAEDPRTESLDDILAEMAEACAEAGGVEGRTFWRAPDRGGALRFAVGLARPGDVVLACGKGHEQSMCFGAVEYPWDDRAALRAALAQRLGLPGHPMPRLPTAEG